MKMGNSDQNRAEEEIERLRKALDAETQRCLDAERQLDRANADFEEFVSMAAHNLRESLRDVASFSQLMAETYAGRLDSDAERIPRAHPGGRGQNAVAARRRGGLLGHGRWRRGSPPGRTWKRSFARRSSARTSR